MKKHQLTVNWHFTEKCNFKCKYCFAHWDNCDNKELFRDDQKIDLLMAEIALLPKLLTHKEEKVFDNIRLNLVGGETFLNKRGAVKIIELAEKYGFSLSAVTNGSCLDEELLTLIANKFEMLGVSVDSINDNTNLLIGRHQKERVVDNQKITNNLEKLRKMNPDIKIKINTVVNRLNYYENMSEFIERVQPNKWKVFKVLPNPTNNTLLISDSQFEMFLQNHYQYKEILFAEDNDAMTESYLMIDPNGRFFQNNGNSGVDYDYSRPILENGIAMALNDIAFDVGKFLARYR